MKTLHEQPLLEIRDLRLVHAIARTGGVGPASAVLHVTQSALSHHLRALEDRLGVAVFDRVGRRVVLNERGAQLVELANRVLPELLAVERALCAPAAPAAVFRLTTGCYTVYPWLPALVERLAIEAPGTRCELVVTATRRAADALRAGEVDAAVMPWHTPDDRLVASQVFHEELIVLCCADDPLAARRAVPASALAGRRVLTHEAPPAETAWFRARLGRGVAYLRDVQRVPLTEAIVELVRAGSGVAILGSWTVERDVTRGEVVARPFRPRIRRPFAVVTTRAGARDPRVEALASVLRQTRRPG
jgi:LysR family transcriptional regulator for metE and metH